MTNLYTYSFCVWPHDLAGFSKDLFDVFAMISDHVEMDFTEEAFNRFRSELEHDGFTLREIERWQCSERENIL